MTTDEVREKYVTFFNRLGHTTISSAHLIPENDSTTLFTGSGMQPLLPYLLGEQHPQGNRLVNSQKCFRAEDIEEVGDNRHTTFFEMLGNWSLGSYFKEEQLSWFFTFLTEELKLNPENLYVTVFSGDTQNGIPRDAESARIWKKLFTEKNIEALDIELLTEEQGGELGMKNGRIFYYDAKKNWWSRAGVPENMPAGEPGGPDSEVFYDFRTPHNETYGKHCHPNCDCGRFLEIGNSVFMEYVKQENGLFKELPQKNVDFGGGLERLSAVTNSSLDVFLVDVLSVIVNTLENLSEKSYSDKKYILSFRIIADHLRAAVFMIADGILPSNTESGYFVRRLIRRSVRHADSLGIAGGKLSEISSIVAHTYKESYPNIHSRESYIIQVLNEEEEKFRKTLTKGLKEFEKLAKNDISGHDAFILFSTYGFPIELTEELALERGVRVDVEEFRKKMTQHQKMSRIGAEQKFKGGLADHSDMSIKYHTATHLLHQALRNVLGDHVFQKGSNITPERLRFDFSHPQKMTVDERKKVEELVNEKIKMELPVSYEDISLEKAEKRGAIGLFEEKYEDTVRVYRMGDFSLEYCGGPHIKNTGMLGKFRIKKEEAVSAGIRRIKAILE